MHDKSLQFNGFSFMLFQLFHPNSIFGEGIEKIHGIDDDGGAKRSVNIVSYEKCRNVAAVVVMTW